MSLKVKDCYFPLLDSWRFGRGYMEKQYKKRRWKCIIFVGLFFLIGCSTTVKKDGNSGIVPKVKIGVLVYRQDDTFISTILSFLQEAAKEKELESNSKITINIFDAKENQTTQNDQIDKLLGQDYDVLCVNIVDRTAAATIIDKAKNAQIPVIFFNREPVMEDLERWEKIYYVGAIASQSGMIQGKIISDAYEKNPEAVDRNQDGKLQYVMLEGEQGHQDALIRTEYSIKTIVGAGINVEKLANDTANWQKGQAMSKMSQWLDRFGDKIEVVICNNDDMALGAIDACYMKKIENFPLIVGVDATAPALEAIQKGDLTGTALNDAEGQAEAILKISYSLALKRNIEDGVRLTKNKYVWKAYKAVTIENLEEIEQSGQEEKQE